MTTGDVGPYRLQFTSSRGVTRDIPGLDDSDDMFKVKSIQKKFRDSWTRTLTDLWDLTTGLGSTASVSGGVLTISSGTTAGGFAELLSKETFTIPFRAMIAVQSGGTRQANNHHIIEAVSVDSVTGIPDGKHSLSMDIGGAANTTVTNMVYSVQNGGLVPLASAASAIVSTATYSILELEPFSDECYFHSRAMDSTGGRSNSYVRHQQIPDPTAVYKIRIRSMNHQGFKAVASAAGGVINTTDVVLSLAAGAGLRRYICSMQLSNNSAVATEVVLKDGATIIWRGHLPANAPMAEIIFENPLRTTANTALNFACITTGAAVYVNAQGFTAP